MIQFLDLIIGNRIPRSRVTRHVFDSIKVQPKPTVPDTATTTPQDTSHVISSADIPSNVQQVADVVPDASGLGEVLGTNMMLAFAVVLVALCICSYFVLKYRKSHSDAV